MSTGRMITQTRDRSEVVSLSSRGTYFGSPENTVWNQTLPGTQVTTSFRSGGSDPSFEQEATSFSQVFQPARSVVASAQYDTGHEFSTESVKLLRTTDLHGLKVSSWDGYGSYTLDGRVAILPYGFGINEGSAPFVPSMSSQDQVSYGSRAIAKTAPTAPKASIAQMLGELKRDGLPLIPGLSFVPNMSTRNLGGEYLNGVFGWQPLIKDVSKLLTSISNSSKLLSQLKRDSGRVVRRSFAFPPSHTSTTTERLYPDYSGSLVPNLRAFERGYAQGKELVITDVVSTYVKFTGAFTYYLDVGEELASKLKGFEQRANYLLGLRLTPDVLWDLAPWSWFADWFGTVGASLSAVSSLQEDGLVIRYGYLQRHTVVDRTTQLNTALYGQVAPLSVSTTYRSSRKERYKATPYGFGLSVSEFNPKKWAILGALGMTKSPGMLR